MSPTDDDRIPVRATLTGTIVDIAAGDGATIRAGEELVVVESMKMHHGVLSPVDGLLWTSVTVGDVVTEGDVLAYVLPSDVDQSTSAITSPDEEAGERADLAEARRRHEVGLDAARPEAVARRRATGQRTARENIDDVCDPGSFVEYGALAIAAQRQRRSLTELIERTPADGLVAGVATVNADLFGPTTAGCVVMAYDYTVLAGTQGHQNHRKTDRMLDLAARNHLPVIFFTEGGGGRPGDTDTAVVSGLGVPTFHTIGRLSGLVPLVGIASGRTFAGNAALLGCCDVIIATAAASIGMGGPAMIAGGGLGDVAPDDVGPVELQFANGVVDILVSDEREAAAVARRFLSYPQGDLSTWDCADQATLRPLIPADRKRAYDIRTVIATLADVGSVLELRSGFGVGIITTLIRIEGRPVGLLANNPLHLGGAIDADAADKAARFLQLCDAYGLPVVSLCDTPGFMVGPEAEKTATVRHFSRMFVTGANLGVPMVTVILRKAYGLGAQAMAGGTFTAPLSIVSWPTGELGPMGLEGAVKLGFRRELDAAPDETARAALMDELIARAYEHGKALNVASAFEIDDVIDPAETRTVILAALRGYVGRPVKGKRRPYIDTW
jgi:acetyl-CoA carboxylase carboxyltransferase component